MIDVAIHWQGVLAEAESCIQYEVTEGVDGLVFPEKASDFGLRLSLGECSPQAKHVVDEVMPVLLEAVESDDDKEAVSVAVAAAAEIVRGVGAAACAQHMQGLVRAVTKVASGNAVCQMLHSDEEEPLEDEEEPEVCFCFSAIQNLMCIEKRCWRSSESTSLIY